MNLTSTSLKTCGWQMCLLTQSYRSIHANQLILLKDLPPGCASDIPQRVFWFLLDVPIPQWYIFSGCWQHLAHGKPNPAKERSPINFRVRLRQGWNLCFHQYYLQVSKSREKFPCGRNGAIDTWAVRKNNCQTTFSTFACSNIRLFLKIKRLCV